MMKCNFVEEMRNKLDLLEMYKHELEMAEEEGDSEDISYFSNEVQAEKREIAKMLWSINV